MLGLVTQTSVYHWSIEGKTFNSSRSRCLPFFWLYFNDYPSTPCSLAAAIVSYIILDASGILGDSEPLKMFERTANLANNQIINYRCDPTEKWLILIGIAPGSQEVSCPILICSLWYALSMFSCLYACSYLCILCLHIKELCHLPVYIIYL